MNEKLYYAPCKSYSGNTLVRITGIDSDLRGQTMVNVEAVNGAPWDDAGMWGFSPTRHAKFYPEHILVGETESAADQATLSTFDANDLLTAIIADIQKRNSK